MQKIQLRCGNCGKKLLTYSKSDTPKYGSPVKKCKKCGTIYADPRFHEIAIEGIPEGVFSVSANVILAVIGALVALRGIYLFDIRMLNVPDAMQWFLPTAFTLIGGAMVIGSIMEIILIKTGKKALKYERLKKESEMRLSDKGYVYTLQNLGYIIPEKYL